MRRRRRLRTRALSVLCWRAGLRISEALAVRESDLDATRGAVLVRRGKGGKRREIGMDRWGWQQLASWLEHRVTLPVGTLLCDHGSDGRSPVVRGGRADHAAIARRRRGRPATLCAAPVAPRSRCGDGARGVPLNVIQRQLGHANLGITSIYLHGIDNAEIIDTVFARRAPVVPASAGLRTP